jgi:hypothetical protein
MHEEDEKYVGTFFLGGGAEVTGEESSTAAIRNAETLLKS